MLLDGSDMKVPLFDDRYGPLAAHLATKSPTNGK
jgi:hypothetical protein